MEFKLSVFILILVVFSVQVYSSKEYEQIKENCFKEVGIHDPVTKEKAMANPDYEFSEKHCLQQCFPNFLSRGTLKKLPIQII